MVFDIRDGYGSHALDRNMLLAQLEGRGVIVGGTVTSAAGAFTVELETTAVYLNGTRHDLASQTLELDEYLDTETGNPRKAVLYVDTAGALRVAPGESAEKRPKGETRFSTYRPAPPDLAHVDAVPLAEVWLDPTDTRLTDADIRPRSMSADISAHSMTAETGDFNEIIDGAGVSHTGELASSDTIRTEAEIREAINSDVDHGSTAPHNYFSGSHADLTNVQPGQHHAPYTDAEARAAVTGTLDAADLTGASGVAGDHLEYTGAGLDWTAPPTQQANVINTGTVTHTGGAATTATITGVTTDELAEFDVSVGVDAAPGFAADYAYSYDVSKQWDDTNGQVNVELTLTWDTDPGTGNDLTLRWVAWETAPALATGRWSDADTIAALDGATITPSTVRVGSRLSPPVYDSLSNAPAPELGDVVVASGAGAESFGQYLYDGAGWVGPLGTSVDALSGLAIDAAKDWQGHPITNLGAPVNATDAARVQELNDHAAIADAHHPPVTGADIDHANLQNVQPNQHHTRPGADEFVSGAAGRVFSLPLTASTIPNGEYLRNHLHVGTGETLTLVRGEFFTANGTVPTNLTLQLYNRDTSTVVYEQTGKIATGSTATPLATISGAADVEARIANTSGNTVAAGGVLSYHY